MKEAKSNFPMILDEPNHRLFVGCRHPARLLILDMTSGKVLGSVEISGDTDDVFYDAQRKQIYVSCGAGFVDVIKPNETGAQRWDRFPTVSGARTSFFSPEIGELYLAVPAGFLSGSAEIRLYKPQ
jgi:hypothetical protein